MFSGYDFEVIQRSLPYLFREGMTFTVTLTLLAMTGGITRHAARDDAVVEPQVVERARGSVCQPGVPCRWCS